MTTKPEVIIFLRKTIATLAQEYADAMIAYYAAKGAANEREALQASTVAFGLLDAMPSVLAAYVVLGNDPAESLRSRARTNSTGATRLLVLAAEVEQVCFAAPPAPSAAAAS